MTIDQGTSSNYRYNVLDKSEPRHFQAFGIAAIFGRSDNVGIQLKETLVHRAAQNNNIEGSSSNVGSHPATLCCRDRRFTGAFGTSFLLSGYQDRAHRSQHVQNRPGNSTCIPGNFEENVASVPTMFRTQAAVKRALAFHIRGAYRRPGAWFRAQTKTLTTAGLAKLSS